jgi:hypothetical protein
VTLAVQETVMNTYSIGSDSPRWWWPSAAIGAVGTAAIAAILILPASGSAPLGRPLPADAPAPTVDPWFSTVDPSVGRQCFALPARRTGAFEQQTPRCGHGPTARPPSVSGVRRRGLDARP